MTAYYNEIDPYCVQWLRNLIEAGLIPPGDVGERSIKDVSPDDLQGYAQCHFFAGLGGWAYACRLAGWPDDRPLWTGSCPCQPFSVAGKNLGAADDRHLWPDWFRLIAAARPDVVMGEQVAAAIGRGWLDACFDDLESVGYACGAAVVPAAGVGAPHKRDRLWFVADATQQPERKSSIQIHAVTNGWQARSELSSCGEFLANADIDAWQQRRAGNASQGPRGRDADRSPVGPHVADADGAGLEIELHRHSGQRAPAFGGGWSWTAEPDVGRVAHGVPARVAKLRALGNAIVPQVAAEIISAFLDTEHLRLGGIFE